MTGVLASAVPTFESVVLGQALPPRTFPVSRESLVRYAGAGGDFNPIHWNERVAREVGLPDVIAHGMFTMATVVQVVTAWAGDPAAVVEYGVRFTKPVVVPDPAGATIEVTGVVAARDEQARTVRVDLIARSDGEKVLARAQVVVALR